MECGVTIIPFRRQKGQKHPSNFGETGECKPPSCSVCELSDSLQKVRNRRQVKVELKQVTVTDFGHQMTGTTSRSHINKNIWRNWTQAWSSTMGMG